MDLSFPDETTTTTKAKENLISIDKMLEWFECAPKELTALREVVIRDLVVTLRSDESDEYEILVKWEPIANDRVKTEPIDSEQCDYNEISEAVVREFAVHQTINEPDNRGIRNEMELETDVDRANNERISRVQFEYIGNESDDSQDEDYEPPRLRRGLSNDETSIGAQNRSIDAILKPFIDAQTSSFNESIENERRRKAKPKFQLNFSIQKSKKRRILNRPKGQKISEITEKLKEKHQDTSTKDNVSEIVQNIPTSQLLSSQCELEDDRLNAEKNIIQSVVVPSTLILLPENTSMNIGPLQLNNNNNHVTIDAIPNVTTPVITAIQPVQLQTSENQQQSQNMANINYRRTIIHRWLNQQNQQETTPFHEQCENAPQTDSMLESSTSSTSSNSISSNSHVNTNQQANQRAKSSTFPKENYNGRRSFKMNNCSVVVNSRYARNSQPQSHSRPSGVIVNPLLLNSSSSRLPSNSSFLPPKVVINPKLVDNPNMIADLHRNQMRVRSSFIGGEPVVVNPKFLK